jgi:glycosyltransferase involved in cell wall biosynthesis
MSKPNLVLFNSLLLSPSETFVRFQGEGLQQFTPYYVGSRLVNGLALPAERTHVVNQGGVMGRLEEGLFKLTGMAPRLTQQLRQINPVLIHAHFGLSGALAMPLAQALKLPLIVTFHGSDATSTDEYARHASVNHRIYLRRREALKQEAHLFIAVSEFIKKKLLETNFPPEKIHVHYIGVDVDKFKPDARVPRKPVVLFVGRLTEKKGVVHLIRAMAHLQAVLPNVELVIIGDGPLRSELEKLATELLNRYQFLGVQPPAVVYQWMNQAMLLAAPSVTASTGDSEGLPIVILEAMAMGLPVVSSIHAGIPEAVLHEETGFLTAEGDWKDLSDYMLCLLKDSALWNQFSWSGQERVKNTFNLRTQNQILEQIYQSTPKVRS